MATLLCWVITSLSVSAGGVTLPTSRHRGSMVEGAPQPSDQCVAAALALVLALALALPPLSLLALDLHGAALHVPSATRHVHSLRARHVQHPTSTQPAPNQHPTSTQLAARPTLGHPHACTRQWAAAGCWCRCTRVYSVSARAWPRRCRRPRCRAIRPTGTPRCKFQGHPGSRSAMGRLLTTERGSVLYRTNK